MEKVPLRDPAFIYPMPMTIVGAMVDGRPNWLAVAWVTPVNVRPLLIGIALGKTHFTNRWIHEHGEFGISIPGEDLLAATDYIGLASGTEVDKSAVFEPFFGTLKNAPMVTSCPVTMECRLVRTVDLPANEFFIGEVVGAWSEERFLTDGQPDVTKMQPFTLTMPDNHYWAVGERLGRAWSIGQGYRTE